FVGEHDRRILIRTRHLEFFCGCFGLRRISVAHRDEFDSPGSQVAPGVQMILREETAPNYAEGDRRWHHSVLSCLSIVGSKRSSAPKQAPASTSLESTPPKQGDVAA